MDEGQRVWVSIKEEVSGSGKGGGEPYFQKKDSMGENTGTTHAYHRENPPLYNQGQTSMVLGSSPRSPISQGTTL